LYSSVAIAGEIEVAGRPVHRSAPQREQHGALEDESGSVGGLSQAVEKPLGGVTLEQELEILAGLTTAVEKPIARRGCNIRDRALRHGESASR
jgi:hypothetical protein